MRKLLIISCIVISILIISSCTTEPSAYFATVEVRWVGNGALYCTVDGMTTTIPQGNTIVRYYIEWAGEKSYLVYLTATESYYNGSYDTNFYVQDGDYKTVIIYPSDLN